MTTKFTQGPFSVAETRHKYDIVIRGPKNEPIALVLIAGFSKKEGAANANLLAAAPDLLDELLSVLDWAITERAPLRNQEIESIRKVIIKATGEQP